jgi:hypothetical protein
MHFSVHINQIWIKNDLPSPVIRGQVQSVTIICYKRAAYCDIYRKDRLLDDHDFSTGTSVTYLNFLSIRPHTVKL